MRYMLYCLLALLLFVAGCTGKTANQQLDSIKPSSAKYNEIITVSSYFPLKENITYIYTSEGNDVATKVVTLEYLRGRLAQFNINNAHSEVVIVGQGAVKKVFSKAGNSWNEELLDQRQKEEIILQQPLKVGTEWKSQGKRYRISSVKSDVTVPYGTYEAIKVVTELDNGIFTRYFAKGIGIIKEEYINGSNVETTQLLEIKRAPLEKEFEIIYLNDKLDELVTSNIKLQISTNKSLLNKAFEALKRTTTEGTVAPIADKAKLLAYKKEANVLRLNVNKEFLRTSSTANEENLCISAVVKTFCNVLGVEGVIINIEEKAYQSSNYSYGIDEVLKAN